MSDNQINKRESLFFRIDEKEKELNDAIERIIQRAKDENEALNNILNKIFEIENNEQKKPTK